MKFVDEATILVVAGDGGNGRDSAAKSVFQRSDGGDGGDGGDVWLKRTRT